MITQAREGHLSKKDRKVLEACCRSPVTLQRDLKRARIVLLAADGRSTRSIAEPAPAGKENQCTESPSSLTVWESLRFKSGENCCSDQLLGQNLMRLPVMARMLLV